MHRTSTLTLLTLVIVSGAGVPALARDATSGSLAVFAPSRADSSIAEKALARYADRAEGVDSYTVIQEVAGQEITQRFVKQEVEGFPVFVPEGSEAAQTGAIADFARIVRRARDEGTADVGGVEAHVLVIDDFEDLQFAALDSAGFEPEQMKLYIDTDEYLPRRMVMKGDVAIGDETRSVTTTVTLSDYRTVEGFAYPFRSKISTAGAMGADSAKMANARKQLEEFDRKLAEMPESQRKVMRQMMGDQLDQLRHMIEAGGIEETIVVTDLRLNTPAGS